MHSDPFSKNIDARVHGHVDVTMLLLKALLVVTVKTLPQFFNKWVLAGLLVSSGVIWVTMASQRLPYYRCVQNPLCSAFRIGSVYCLCFACKSMTPGAEASEYGARIMRIAPPVATTTSVVRRCAGAAHRNHSLVFAKMHVTRSVWGSHR